MPILIFEKMSLTPGKDYCSLNVLDKLFSHFKLLGRILSKPTVVVYYILNF